jgi:hypothetical protein
VLAGFSEAQQGLAAFAQQLQQAGQAGADAGRYVDEFGNKWTKSLSEAEQQAIKTDAGFKVLGATLGGIAGAAALYFGERIASAAIDVARTGEQLYLFSQRTGVAAESLSELTLAGSIAGAGLEEMGRSIEKFSRAIVNAGTDNDQTGGAFKRLGIDVRDAEGQFKSTEALLLEVADAFHEAADGATKTEIALALFGRAGAQMIPVLNQGAAGIDELRRVAREAGIVLGTDAVKAAHDLHEGWAVLGAFASGFWVQVATPIVMSLAYIIKTFADAKAASEGFGEALRKLDPEYQMSLALMGGGVGASQSQVRASDNAIAATAAGKVQLPGKETGPKPDEIMKDYAEQARLLYETGKISLDAYIVALDDIAEHYGEDSVKRLTFEKQLQDALRQERDRAAREESVQMGEELAAIQKGVYWTREEKITALEALLEKYRQLGEDAPHAYQRIQLAIVKTIDESQTLEQGLAKTFGQQDFNKNVIEGFKGVRDSMARNYSEILKGHESLGDGIKNIWHSVGDSMINSVAKMLADESMKGLLELVGLKPGTSNVSWMQGVWAYLKSSFASVTDALGQGLKAVFSAVSQMVGSLLDVVTHWLSDALGGLSGGGGGFGGLFSAIGGLFGSSAGASGAGSAVEAGAVLAQHGGEHVVTRPTLFMAGEGGVAEHVRVTPLTMGGGGRGGGGVVVNFHGPTVMDEYSAKLWTRDLARRMAGAY